MIDFSKPLDPSKAYIDCPSCQTKVLVDAPRFEIVNGDMVSMIVWSKPSAISCICGQKFQGAIVGCEPQGIQAAILPVQRESGIDLVKSH